LLRSAFHIYSPQPPPKKHHQANFTSLEALITRIHKDADEARRALGAAPLSRHAGDAFLAPSAEAAAAGAAVAVAAVGAALN